MYVDMFFFFYYLGCLFVSYHTNYMHIVNRLEEDLEKKENDVMKMKQRLLEEEFDKSW